MKSNLLTWFKTIAAIACWAFVFCYSLSADAQSPSAAVSDSLAQQIIVGNCATGLIIDDATVNDPVASSCDAPVKDGWLWFDATSSKTSICFYNTSSRDVAMYVYTSKITLTEVACVNALGNSKNEILILNTAIGTRYHVRMARVGHGSPVLTGDVCIFNTPANDDCSAAISLVANAACSPVAGSTKGATQSANAILCNGVTGKSDDDVWYSFVAPASQKAVISVTGASAGFNPVIDLRSGACNGASISCADANASNGDETLTTTGLTAGQKYYVRVYGFAEASTSASGTFNICIADNCAALMAYAVTGGGSYCQGSVSGMPVGLAGSEAAATYQLKLNGVNVGSPVSGSGSAISFGLQGGVGTYTVDAIAAGNSCSAPMTGNAQILSSSNPPYSYIGNVTASVTNACSGSAFTATVLPVAGASEYVWSAPEGSSINGTMITSTVTSVATSSPDANIVAGNPYGSGYYIFAYARNGCGRTLNTKATWVQGTLSTPAIPAGNKIVCTSASSATTEKYSVPAVSGADGYSWSVSTTSGTASQIIGSSTGNSIEVYYPTGFVSGTISVAARFNCGYTGAARVINISTTPAIPGAITGADKLCPGTTATYMIAKVEGAATYSWGLPSGATLVSTGMNATMDTAVIQFPANFASGTVCMTPISACGQVGTVRCKSVYSSLPAMPSGISGSLTGACNTMLQYTTPAGLANTSQYQWTLNGSVVAGETYNTANIQFASGGDVCVRGINSACPVSNNAGAARCISVSARPMNPGSISGPAAVCPGGTYQYSVPAVAGLTYEWTIPSGCSITSSSGNSIAVLWSRNSGGIINVTASNECEKSNTSVLSITTNACRIAANTVDFLNAVSVYPNPAQDQLTVAYSSLNSETCTIRLLDMTGRHVMEQHNLVNEGSNQFKVSLSDLSKGIYLLQLESPSMPLNTTKVIIK